MIYDVIIIGGGASGLFASVFLPKEMKKLILEKNEFCGSKILLSGGSRCNVTNYDIDFDRDYVGQNLKGLPSVFHRFNNQDMIQFLGDHGIETVVEDSGRVILKSGKARQLLDLLLKLAEENDVEIETNTNTSKSPFIKGDHFVVETDKENYQCKKLIIATGGKSYPQIGATSFVYDVAKQFGIDYVDPYPGLCGMETVQDMSPVTGNAVEVRMQLLNGKKCLYDQKGNLLFTHWGISGPLVFDATLHMCKSPKIKLFFDLEKTNKKLVHFFGLDEKNLEVELDVKKLRPWEEAKVMGGGIVMDELKNFESKKVPGLYFMGEACDVTGRTGGYNLQRAWSSGYVVAKNLSK